ncbi:hypothetical protein AVEN_187637-1 [Araneus ventricosus]|uniref:Uncharacterized protein n=1 Tax=Araneus ventricosus TaxID=182803 RepID=A0A4Y2E0D6_ARAVE|nr:hypothetical protein AVEN_187637-1 [Araneus ventricosus]
MPHQSVQYLPLFEEIILRLGWRNEFLLPPISQKNVTSLQEQEGISPGARDEGAQLPTPPLFPNHKCDASRWISLSEYTLAPPFSFRSNVERSLDGRPKYRQVISTFATRCAKGIQNENNLSRKSC